MIRYSAFTKDFGAQRAVDALTLEVPRGTVVALLGPNGSGKTTTHQGGCGAATAHGRRGAAGRGRSSRRPLPTARQTLRLSAADGLRFPTRSRDAKSWNSTAGCAAPAAEATDRVLKFASLNGSSDRAVGTYSGGMLQRLGLAVAMIPRADILLLDEPTAALDPEGLCALYGLIEERRRDGAAILFSSHQLGDVERLANRIAVLAKGRLTSLMSERDLADRLAERGVLRVRLQARVDGLLERVRALSPQAVWFGDELIVPGSAALRPAALDVVRAAGGEITGLTAQEGRLDEFYREVVGEAV